MTTKGSIACHVRFEEGLHGVFDMLEAMQPFRGNAEFDSAGSPRLIATEIGVIIELPGLVLVPSTITQAVHDAPAELGRPG